MQSLLNLDIQIFRLINTTCSNPAFDFLMPQLSVIGSGQMLAVIALLMLLFKKTRLAGVVILAGLSVTYYIVDILKDLVARPRPFAVLPDVRMLEAATRYSFPSNHSTQAFMAAMVFWRYFRRGAVFFSLALLVAFSRMYLGVHYLSDVIAGAIIGMVCGYILVKAVGKPETS